jgi:hypothetical protein
VDDPRASAGAAGYRKRRPKKSSQKIQKSSKSVLTGRAGSDYIRLTNEGGTPLAAKKFASRPALCEIQESRVSDTRGPEAESDPGHDIAFAMSVL